MANVIIIISALIVVLAACFTALYARSIHKMVSEMKSKDDEYQHKMNELHNMIVSRLLSSNAEKIEIEIIDIELEVLKKFQSGKNINFKEREYPSENPDNTPRLISCANSIKELVGNMFKSASV